MTRKADEAITGGPAPGPGSQPPPATRGQRWLARLAFVAAIAAVVVLLLFGGLRSITALLLGFVGLAVTCAADGGSSPSAASCAGSRSPSLSPRRCS